MVGHAVWKFAGGWLVFGVRKPGTYVPMVGLYERAKWTWKSEVPVANPLEAQEGGPRWLSLRGDSLVVGYESARKHYLTRLDARTGMRSWTVEVPSLVAIAQNEQLVVAHGADSARVLSLRDGSLLTTL